MSSPNERVLDLLNRLTDWARGNPDVRAMLLIGSRTRADHPADQWSDVDVVLGVTDPDPFLNTAEWLEPIAPIWVSHVERTPVPGVVERRVLFDSGFDFDLIVVHGDSLIQVIKNEQASGIIRRGMRVLVDKDRIFSRITLPIAPRAIYEPPTQAAFLNVVNDFWYHAAWMTKKFRRGELWTAVTCNNGYMKDLLLRMIEWYSRTVGATSDVPWANGRFLEEWADPRAVRELGGTFAHYDPADLRRALRASMSLFRWLAIETAFQLNYPYPVEGDAQVSAWVEQQLADET